MRALVFHGPWDIRVEERPDPQPAAGEVLIEILATGICGSDIHGFTGENGRRKPDQVMGHETVGRIRSHGGQVADAPPVGSLVTVNPILICGECPSCRGVTPGRCTASRVIGVAPEVSSAFADLMVAPARNIVSLPADLLVDYGALVEPLSVGFHAVSRGQCTGQDDVLIIGGGPIGQSAALAARRLGARSITVSEPDSRRRTLLAALEITAVEPAGLDSLTKQPTLVVDCVGASGSIADALRVSAPGARIVLVGMQRPSLEIAAYAVSVEERTIVGSYSYTDAEFADTARWVGGAPPELAHLIEGRVGWESAAETFTGLAKGENPASKVLVYPGGAPG
jgi:threonine dehydrogenase-like Zn-dependent dehydrogenase